MNGKLLLALLLLFVLYVASIHRDITTTRSTQELTIDSNVLSPTFGLPLDDQGNVITDEGAP